MTHAAAYLAPLLGFGFPGGYEWIILLVLGLLIFGRRLPEVGRSLGKGIVEFKRGIKGIEDEIDDESSRPAAAESVAKPPELPTPTPTPTVPRASAEAAEPPQADEDEHHGHETQAGPDRSEARASGADHGSSG
jgi:sec-independent protein translocase protein TatA